MISVRAEVIYFEAKALGLPQIENVTELQAQPAETVVVEKREEFGGKVANQFRQGSFR